MKKTWKDSKNNSILLGDGFYISYNPDTSATKGTLMAITLAAAKFGLPLETDGRAETALVSNGERKIFYILNGDFRKDYEKLVSKGFKACHDFYLSKKQFRSNWSTDN